MKTLNDAIQKYEEVERDFRNKKPLSADANGGLVFAGSYWPKKNNEIDSMVKHDVTFAFEEARKISMVYTACKAAILGNNDGHVKRMEKWFGKRTSQPKDWWLGVSYIIGAIETHIMKNINIYYRGDDSLVGKPNDYPNTTGSLVEYDVSGFAESKMLVSNNIIGLCEDFFAKNKNGSIKIKLTGRDSVGGVLVHELSHNICGTDDHENQDGTEVYGVGDCMSLANKNPELAWYNADNIEYFSEDVVYKL